MLMRQREFPFVSCTAEGCTQSFQEAKGWYSRAVAGLSAAVRKGESWYRGALKNAEAGLARAEQEVSGKY